MVTTALTISILQLALLLPPPVARKEKTFMFSAAPTTMTGILSLEASPPRAWHAYIQNTTGVIYRFPRLHAILRLA